MCCCAIPRDLPARSARVAAGYSLEKAAKAARVTPRYLSYTEHNGAPYVLALRLAVLYKCKIDVFITPRGGKPRLRLKRGR